MLWEGPGALWLGLTVPAILLLWMLRPRRQRHRVPSLMLWPGSATERQSARPWQRLKNHPLLWLQVLAAVLLTLAAARPFLPASAAGRHLVVFLDASGSMRAADVAPDRFARALDEVMALARGLGPEQEVTVLRVDEEPEVLVARARSAAQVGAALEGQRPSFGPGDAAAALALAAGLTQGPAEWVFISDGGLALAEGARRPAGTGFRFIPVGEGAANVAVTGLTVRQGESGVTLQAGLRNTGPEAVSGRLQLLAEGRLLVADEFRLEPGDETHLTWSHLPEGPAWYEARLSGVEAGANLLAHDDAAWAAVHRPVQPAAMLVTEGNAFLERVLAVHGGIRAYKAAPEDWESLTLQSQGYALVIADRFAPEEQLPGSLLLVGPPGGEEFRPEAVYPRADHPVLRHVDWSDVRVGAARRLDLGPEWEVVVDSDGGPLLAVRADGERREAVLAFALHQSDLPLRPAFPVLMANLLEWLLPGPGEAPRAIPAGAELAVEPGPLVEAVWVEPVVAPRSGAGGERADLVPPWPPRPFRPSAPGLYRLVETGQGFAQQSFLVAVGYHPQESDPAPVRLHVPAPEGEPAAAARGALSLWPYLLLAALALSLGEWWLDARGR